MTWDDDEVEGYDDIEWEQREIARELNEDSEAYVRSEDEGWFYEDEGPCEEDDDH